MDEKFITSLKATLTALIEENKVLKTRLAALEHSVNDVIIGGLKDAANEYEDNEKYSQFVDDFSTVYGPYEEISKILNGDDYDISEALYEGSKGVEDVAGFINCEIAKYQAKADALRALKNGTAVEESIPVAEEPVITVVEEETPVDEKSEDEIFKELSEKYLKGE